MDGDRQIANHYTTKKAAKRNESTEVMAMGANKIGRYTVDRKLVRYGHMAVKPKIWVVERSEWLGG